MVTHWIKHRGGSDYDTQAALKMGNMTYTRETPTGSVTEPGCGCGTLLRCTVPLIYLQIADPADRVFIAPQAGVLQGYARKFDDPSIGVVIGPLPLSAGDSYVVPFLETFQYPYIFAYAFECV